MAMTSGGDDGEWLGKEAMLVVAWRHLDVNELDPSGGEGAGFGEDDEDKWATGGVIKRGGGGDGESSFSVFLGHGEDGKGWRGMDR